MNGRLAFNLLLLAAAGYFVWSAMSFEPQARQIPLLVGVMVLVLQGIVTVRAAFATDSREVADGGEHGPPRADEGRRVAAACGWMVLFFALFAVIGTLAATFLFILSFLLGQRDVPWWKALAIAAVMAGAIWLLFARLMKFELYPGVLFGGALPPL